MSSRWAKCWAADREIFTILNESDSLEAARQKIIGFLEALDWSYRHDYERIHPWDYILLKEAVRCMKNIISPRNENLSGSSALKLLWTAAREGDAEVSDDFISEFTHLFKAIKGHSDVYPSILMDDFDSPDFDMYQGRDAALKRSEFLDEMGHRMDQYIARYPHGLDPKIIKKRSANKTRILDYFDASEGDWNDWKWQFKNVYKNGTGLEPIKKIIQLKPDEEEAIKLAVEHDVPFGITPHYLSLMDPKPTDYDFAIRRQVIPSLNYVESMIKHKDDRKSAFDFMREHDTSPVDLVTRRYTKVAIIKPYDSCPQICVYCQRNWEITAPLMDAAMATKEQLDSALDWYSDHEHMMDILVTGGDPLVMNNNMIDKILSRLSEMKHIKHIRIATRIPITVPQRITDELCEILGNYYDIGNQIICMVTHFSHPYEITPETTQAIGRVRKKGLNVYNQQVFTFGNSRRFETVALRIAMKLIGVDPYYTFNMKGKSEMEDYAVPVARLLQERKEEARLLPGVFRTDEPVFNVPFLGKNHLRAWQHHELVSITPDGRRQYSFHPWEKNIDKVKPYLYTDVTIGSYLRKLEERGEDIEEYKSIWYYY
jgi:lysine 2,3-aminomutase